MLKRRILSVLLVLAMLVPFAGAAQTAQDNMRGVWVASVANIDYPSSAGMTAQALAAANNYTAAPVCYVADKRTADTLDHWAGFNMFKLRQWVNNYKEETGK